MSQIPTTTRITREELQGEAEQQIESLLRPLNLFFEDVVGALDKDLTIQENLDASIVTVAINTGPGHPSDWQIVRFQHGMKRRPSGSVLINTVNINDYDEVFTNQPWAQVRFVGSQGEILTTNGLSPDSHYTLTFLIL